MLDSDDLLGRTYMQEAAAFVTSGFPVDIVPGCMRNFDAVTNDWCFPEGWSVQVGGARLRDTQLHDVMRCLMGSLSPTEAEAFTPASQGAIHWNKFHASVLMSRRLLEAVGASLPSAAVQSAAGRGLSWPCRLGAASEQGSIG